MNKERVHVIVLFCMLIFFSFIFFFGGILGLVFSIKHYVYISNLQKSNIVENVIISKKERGMARARQSSSMLIYFTSKYNGKTYRMYLPSGLQDIKLGDEIEVRFNDKRTWFWITNYSFLIRVRYFSFIIMLSFCIYLSELLLTAAKEVFCIMKEL